MVLYPSGRNPIAVGAREVRSGRVGLYGRPLLPLMDVDPKRWVPALVHELQMLFASISIY